jgi:hypothetical protein
VFVDAGYGTGIVSAGRTQGAAGSSCGSAPRRPSPGFKNKRAEMWADARDWLKAGGAIDPNDQVLYQDLIGPETVATLDGSIQLEAKKDMKKRGLPSPGRGDALALSFAFPVSAKAQGLAARTRERDRRSYSPYTHASRANPRR